ncbi:MAG: PH domain-containing protein [Verrucomicrobiales bacterium]|nr:PH domain-containing protein [Verrucomicrobiales bacterium]
MKHYQAPWGRPLVIVSALATALCLGLTLFEWSTITRPPLGIPAFWLGLLPLALVIGCALFTIRGYALTPDTLLIHRLLWSTRVSLAELQSAEYLPGAMRGSIRTCGNGGFFSVTGLYWSRLLGSYRAFVTDLQRTVVLRFPGRTLVLSPESPEEFVRVVSMGYAEAN